MTFRQLLQRHAAQIFVMVVGTAIVFVALPIVLPILLVEPDKYRPIFDSVIVKLTLAAMIGILGARSMLQYLRVDSELETSGDMDWRDRIQALEEKTERFEQEATAIRPADRDAIIAALRDYVSKMPQDHLVTAVEARYADQIAQKIRVETLGTDVRKITDRLETEIRALMRRGNLNLVLGTLTTAVAAGLLAYVALTTNVTSTDWRQLLPVYLLRLSLVIFIEIFAFFFLRLYKTSLSEIKYYQNEITNIQSRWLALAVGLAEARPEMIQVATDALAKTERNFLLEKTQTTVELEQIRLEGRNLRNLTSTLGSILKKSDGKEA